MRVVTVIPIIMRLYIFNKHKQTFLVYCCSLCKLDILNKEVVI